VVQDSRGGRMALPPPRVIADPSIGQRGFHRGDRGRRVLASASLAVVQLVPMGLYESRGTELASRRVRS
jgi:hypothetical protein